jgi:hypothetical protein
VLQCRSERAFQVDEELCKRRKGLMATTQHRFRIFRVRDEKSQPASRKIVLRLVKGS